MTKRDVVPGEVIPEPGRQRDAAAALQELGFRVLHVGSTISVDAPADRWTSVFGVTAPTGTPDRRISDDLPVPERLRGLVRAAYLVPPPQFF